MHLRLLVEKLGGVMRARQKYENFMYYQLNEFEWMFSKEKSSEYRITLTLTLRT